MGVVQAFRVKVFRSALWAVLAALALAPGAAAIAQDTALSDRAKARDANKNGVIDRDEAGGPLADNFNEMDCDKSGGLDGAEIRGFFTGAGCPKKAAAKPAAPAVDRKLSGRAQGLDANKNGVIDRPEARGPLADNFAEMDCDKSGGLDGAEIQGYFTGSGCPGKSATASAPKKRNPKALRGRAYASDTNDNGVLERNEAGGPLAANFEKVDSDRSGTLDGAEISKFFQNRRSPPRPSRAGAPRRGRPPPRVMLDTVVTQPVNQTFPVIGRVAALQSGIIASQIGGALVEMRVAVGDRVEKGQVIASIARDRMEAERDRYAAAVRRYRGVVATAKAEYEKKQREFQRLVRLRKSAAFSRARYDDLERDVQSRKGSLEEKRGQLNESRAQLKRAEIDLADTEIKAPFPGVVSEKHTDVGTYLRIGDRIVTVINDRDVEIEADVPTERLRGIPIGTAVKARLTGGTVLRASIRAIVPQENIRTRTRPVRFKIETNGSRVALAANQSVTVDIPVASGKTAVTVHKDAIVRRGERAIIFRIEKNKPIRRQVMLGAAVGDRFIVLSGAKAGDRLVVRGNETLPPGAPVKIIDSVGG